MKNIAKKPFFIVVIIIMLTIGIACSIISLNFGNQYKSHINELKMSQLVDKLAFADGDSAKTQTLVKLQNQLKIKFAVTFVFSLIGYIGSIIITYIYYTSLIKDKE